ncbi:MAG: hypothetical protein QG567_1818 [Campylobacterota bacterium]|nr:hypothetical protein [Campylobacterota bacterium]
MNPFKAAKAFFWEPMVYYSNVFKSSGALMIEDIGDEDETLVYVNDFFQELYCVELAGAGENISFLPQTLINSLAADFAEDETGEITWVLLKDGLLKKNLIFTRNKDIATQIQNAINSKILNFKEVFDRILSLYYSNEYEIDWYEKILKQRYSIDINDEYKNPLNILNALIRERAFVNYGKCKYYQAVGYANKFEEDEIKFNIEEFFKINFKGALYTRIVFDKKRMKAELESQKLNTTGQFNNRDKNKYKALIKSIDTHNRVLINTTLQVFEDYGKTVSTQVEKAANCKLDIISRSTRELSNKTPIFCTNKYFSRIANREFLYKYISFNSKLDSDQPHLVGTNKDQTFVNFGFKKGTEKNSIPKAHTILLGTSGAGKTQAANDILKQLLGYDYEAKKIHNIGDTNHIIFDIKDSFYNQIKKIHSDFPHLVDINTFDKNKFMYNIIDCDVVESNGKRAVLESDLDFASTLVSLVLNSGGGDEALTPSESEEFKQAIREMYTHNSFEKLTLVSIRHTNEDEYRKLRELGYKEHTPFDEVKEPQYEKFKKPLLHNVINFLKQKESQYQTTNQQIRKKLIESLVHKLTTIQSMQIFSSYSRLDFEDKEIIYFRTDDIAGGNDYGYLVFAMQAILAKKIKAEQHAKRLKGQKRPLVFFWFEEARNIFANKLFKEKEVFERIINEWRSYDMVFFPITQEPEHIPDSILNGFEIKMILTSGDDEEEKENLINNLSKRLAIGDNRKNILKTLPKYTMFVMYGDGAFTMKFKDDEAFRKIVNT